MKKISRAISAHLMVLMIVVVASLSSSNATAKKLRREELEIGSWSLTDVTDQYPGIDQRFQDSISTCSDGVDANAVPGASVGGQQPGTPGFQIPGNPAQPDPFGPPTPVTPGTNLGTGGFNGGYNGGYNGGFNGGTDPVTGQPTKPDPISRIIGVGIAVDVITNMGHRVWDLINFGKPVSWVNTSVAHGLPKGIKCWTELEGWSWPQSKVYNVNYKNKLGGNVADYTYRISYIYGGNIEGIGQYLSNVQIVPMNLKVAWSYAFNSRAEVPTVFNVGSKKNPIAGMQVNVRWKVESSLMSSEQSHMFQIGGNNVFKKVEQ